MIETRNINPGAGGTRIARQKYEQVKKAILASVPASDTGMLFKDLPRAVGKRLPRQIGPAKGSVSWYTTVVKLDLEARGLIERIEGSRPQRLRRPR